MSIIDFCVAHTIFQLNIHQFKCFARFGLMHIVATNICVWIRTVFKEGIKDIAAYRVARGEGVSEDYMIKGQDNILLKLLIYLNDIILKEEMKIHLKSYIMFHLEDTRIIRDLCCIISFTQHHSIQKHVIS